MQVKFRHTWLPRLDQTMSLWDFFNLINDASEKPTEAENSRIFFRNYTAPVLSMNNENCRQAERLTTLSNEFLQCVSNSMKAGCFCCRCCCEGDLIFSRLDQAKHILHHSFEGVHFAVEGPTGNDIDCMFFPCTTQEQVLIDGKPAVLSQFKKD